jgi:hypothetical protein
MDIDDPKITALKSKVTAAQKEFGMAVTFHEMETCCIRPGVA